MSLSGVHCTFWSLGESLKPGGFVNTFVVSCFCYSLLSKPNGHLDFSKRHYFFSNMGVSFCWLYCSLSFDSYIVIIVFFGSGYGFI